MKLKNTLSLLALASCAAVSTSTLAQSSGGFYVKGYATGSICTPLVIEGLNGNVVALPEVTIDTLSGVGSSTGETAFTFKLTGCETSANIDNMWVHFDSQNVDGDGLIIPYTGSQNLRFELIDGLGGNRVKAGGTAGISGPDIEQGTGALFSGNNPDREASKTYAVRYHAPQGATVADVGEMQAWLTYNIYYY